MGEIKLSDKIDGINRLHYKENVWLQTFSPLKKGQMQMVSVCIRLENGDFAAVDAIYLYDGIYYDSKTKPIGSINDAAFLNYIERLTGINNYKENGDTKERKTKTDIPLEEIYEEYKNTNSIRKAAKRAGISQEKTKKILISAGLYTSEKYEKIKRLLEQGKTIDEISDELKMSQKQLRIFMASE